MSKNLEIIFFMLQELRKESHDLLNLYNQNVKNYNILNDKYKNLLNQKEKVVIEDFHSKNTLESNRSNKLFKNVTFAIFVISKKLLDFSILTNEKDSLIDD